MIDQHRKAFREEALELLGELDRSLLELEGVAGRFRADRSGLHGHAYDQGVRGDVRIRQDLRIHP